MILPLFPLAQVPPAPAAQEIVQPQAVRPLPSSLDGVAVFHSNSPELVLNEGILLSTFPPDGQANPNAHLNFPLSGRFDIFAHHVARAATPEDLRTLYLAILLSNPNPTPVTICISAAASYLSQPDAPFLPLPSQIEDPDGTVYAGPGSRVMGDILRQRRQENFPPQIVIPPQTSRLLLNAPIPVRDLTPPLNGRSTYLRLRSNGRVYAASLAMFAPTDENGQERQPTLEEWETLLQKGALVTPRDRPPTPPHAPGSIIYGRVAGVAQGATWQATLTDGTGSSLLTIPPPGEAISYGLSTLEGGTWGTGQIQSGPMLVRYPDTAYKSHGNYGVQYSLTLPLSNPTTTTQRVAIALQTPLKQDQLTVGLRFLEPPSPRVFFRGTVRVRYPFNQNLQYTRYFHLVQHQGEEGKPLLILSLLPQEQRTVQVEFLYPPDATPPQVLTIRTLDGF